MSYEEKLKTRLKNRAYYQNVRKHDPVYKEKNRVRSREAHLKRLSTPEGAAAYKLVCKNRQTHQKLRRLQEIKAGRPRPEGCEVCGLPCRTGKNLAFDHDHKTGIFRGWLCSSCNIALGLVGDSPAILRALVDYIERSLKNS